MTNTNTNEAARLSRAGRIQALLVVLACTFACAGEEPAESGGGEAKADAPAAASAGAAEADAELPPSSLGAGLDAALDLGIVPPQAGGSSYRVDPFVAALAFAAAEREASRWFSPYAGTPAKVDYEVRGFSVTAAGERAGLLRLGLHEGDVVEEVNGVPVTDGATIRGALAGSDDGVTVGVFREDYSFVIGYRFEPGLAWMRTREEGGIEAAAPAADDGAAAQGDGGTPQAGDPDGGDEADDGGAVVAVRPEPSAGGGGGSKAPSSSGGAAKPGGAATPRPSTPTPSSPKSPGSSGASSPVSCKSDASCTIRKSYFDSMVSSPSKLESQAKIVPAIRNDVFSGYKLSWIRPGSAIDEMGFRAGDKITHINGQDLTDDAQAFAVYLSLSSTRSYEIRYVRGTRSLTKTLGVK